MGEPLGQRLAKLNKEMDRLLEKGDIGSKFMALRKESQRIESTMVDRNLKGKELEKQGKIEEAITLYELNVSDEVDTPAPYNRLAVIYRKQKRFDDEVKILDKAVKMFPKNGKFKIQLEKTKAKQVRKSVD